jgi:hypothetical protein
MGDYSRKTFNREKHYSGVQMQQGRVQVDADWNEQLDIHLYRTETEAVDVIGPSGVPKKNNGFKIGTTPDGHDLTIAAGRIYVEGLLCELDKAATYTAQPYLPNPEFSSPGSPPSSPPQSSVLSLKDGTYLVFLDAWQREITALDDKLLREVALGGPDTTTRLQNVWQVRLLQLETSPPNSPPASPPNATVDCNSPFAQFDQLTAPTTGRLNARTQPLKPEENVCLLPPTAGYNRLENQLYRVEVHSGGALNQATFKWSRDNASVETKIKKISGNVVTVTDLGKDEVLSFAGGQWVEIVDDESTLKSSPHPLAQIDKIGPGVDEITLKTSVAAVANLPGLKLRRWDQTGAAAKGDGVNATLATWVELEGGIEVSFGAGNYHPGDYWLIPARTATGEIEWPPFEVPNTAPVPQPPRGIHHHFCRLALVQSLGGNVSILADCRKPFPALTEICAEDICFDNDNCQLVDVDTVQEAIDRLCAERDLRFHNKHLHGWGIVCGLQVECGPDPLGQPRRHVSVRKGYAIDCEGNDIILEKDDRVDLIGLIEDTLTSPPASPPGNLSDRDVCLVLDSSPKSKTRYHVEPYPQPKSKTEALLKGTLLMDFFTECVESLTDFFKEQFTTQPGEEKEPVGPTQKRITTFSNLLIQLTNKENGAFVFLSGEKDQSARNLEDTILRDFYTKLRAKLQSHTFCAMFENARQFPEYPYAGLNIATIFSKGFQTRVRVAPNSAVGYSVGASNKINVFDLNKNEMVDELEFPGGPGVIVQDVAFSKDGKQLYAVATVNNKDSMFAVVDVSGVKHTFRKPSMICDILVVTLATSPSTSENVFGIGKGKGLYEINPLAVIDKPIPKYAFNASGHLVVIDKLGLGFATANDAAGSADRYDRVRRLNLKAVENPRDFNTAAHDPTGAVVFTAGEDDIAVSLQGNSAKLYAVSVLSSVQSDKQVAVFNALDNAASPVPIGIADLGENTTIRLEHNPVTSHVMVSYEDSYRIGLINQDNRLVSNYRHPVQISPLSIAVAPDQKRTYVLNYASNTVSSIPSDMFAPTRQIPLQPLVDYRADVLNAFADLLGGLLQYLKDCFCDHLLVDCPECGPDDKLYLACISIRNGQVFKVCNFSLRKYVHSFPTVEYWLSVVPIIPLIKNAVERFCCAALPTLFGKFNAPRPQPPATGAGKNTLKSAQIRKGVTLTQQTDFKAAISDVTARVMTGRPVFGDFLSNTGNKILVPQPNTVTHTDVAGQPVVDVRTRLEAAGVVVDKVEAYNPALSGQNLIEFTAAPVRLEQGTRVKLITRDDKVLFYTRAEQPPPAVEDLRIQVEATRAAVDENKAVSTANKAEIDSLLPRLQDLTSKVESAKTAVDQTAPQILELRSQVERASATIDRATPEIEDLRAKIGTNTNDILTNKTSLADALRMRDEVTTLRNELLQVRQTHQQELAARDKQIADLKLGARDLQATVQRVNELKSEVDRLSAVRPRTVKKTSRKKNEPT